MNKIIFKMTYAILIRSHKFKTVYRTSDINSIREFLRANLHIYVKKAIKKHELLREYILSQTPESYFYKNIATAILKAIN
jgi:hypothetical protein